MHWGQIKSLLIVSFLVLDVYLLIQVLDKNDESDISVIEYQESSIEEQLLAESIKIPTLSDDEHEETYITVEPATFTDEDLQKAIQLKKQEPFLITENLLVSTMDEQVKVPESVNEFITDELLGTIIPNAEEYSFWKWDEQYNVLVYFQNKEERPIYYNQNGLVLLFVDEDDEVLYYTQTKLGETETLAEHKALIKPMNAIEVLYNANRLKTEDEVVSVNIGFHTRVPSESGIQVFAPVWKVTVNEEDDYFINAIEGLTISTKEDDFVEETIKYTLEKINDYSQKDRMVDTIKQDLEDRLDDLYRGDS